MYEINIYGVISPSDYSLDNLKTELAKANGKDIQVNINSIGGEVNEGLAMYSRLRKYASENNATITTVTEGNCASIATIVFLAGDVRKLNQYIEPFVHNAWTMSMGDSNDMQRVADNLEQTNEKLAKFYAEHTELTYDEARALMDNETFITPDEALKIRFCTQLDEIVRPAALQRFNNSKNIKMNDTKVEFTKEHESILNKFMNFLSGKQQVKNLMVYTASNDELEFPTIETEGDIQIGIEATINGEKATGSHLMKSGDTYVFEDGKLAGIIEEEDEEIENLKNDLQAKEAELEEVNNKLTEALTLMNEYKDVLNNLKGQTTQNQVTETQDPPKDEAKVSKFQMAINNLKNK